MIADFSLIMRLSIKTLIIVLPLVCEAVDDFSNVPKCAVSMIPYAADDSL